MSDLFFSNPFQHCLIADEIWQLSGYHGMVNGKGSQEFHFSGLEHSRAVNLLGYRRLPGGSLLLHPLPSFGQYL